MCVYVCEHECIKYIKEEEQLQEETDNNRNHSLEIVAGLCHGENCIPEKTTEKTPTFNGTKIIKIITERRRNNADNAQKGIVL